MRLPVYSARLRIQRSAQWSVRTVNLTLSNFRSSKLSHTTSRHSRSVVQELRSDADSHDTNIIPAVYSGRDVFIGTRISPVGRKRLFLTYGRLSSKVGLGSETIQVAHLMSQAHTSCRLSSGHSAHAFFQLLL